MSQLDLTTILTVLAIVGSGLMAGVYYTFSTFTMAGLRSLPASQGAAAMQAVNLEAPRPPLMSVFFGTAVIGVALYVLAITSFEGLSSVLSISGASLYISSIVITGVFNVPLNDRLEAANPASPQGVSVWTDYQRRWTRYNHVRVGVSVASAVVLTLSLVV
jgi:uncharacterized membrane protein